MLPPPPQTLSRLTSATGKAKGNKQKRNGCFGLTRAMRRASPVSDPPWMRKPHGRPPRSRTRRSPLGGATGGVSIASAPATGATGTRANNKKATHSIIKCSLGRKNDETFTGFYRVFSGRSVSQPRPCLGFAGIYSVSRTLTGFH